MFEFRAQTLSSPGRVPSVDYWRAVAMIGVVVFHFGFAAFGYLGVDLFFVISGLLVSRGLITGMRQGRRPEFLKFVVSRAFKIWPSYYSFLFLGTLLALALYSTSNPAQVISLAHAPRYLFFFQNYRGSPHQSFDHVWSLCVEEHFYLLLPLCFLALTRLRGSPLGKIAWGASFMIVAGNLFRCASYLVHFETFSATHNRIDGLAWGVLLAVVIESRRGLRWFSRPVLLKAGALGVLTLAAGIWACQRWDQGFFKQVIFEGLTPAAFSLLVLATYRLKAKVLYPLRVAGYYSYNWYLWHPIFLVFIEGRLGHTPLGFACYVAAGLALAVAATHAIEEPMLAKRRVWLGRIFPMKGRLPAARDARILPEIGLQTVLPPGVTGAVEVDAVLSVARSELGAVQELSVKI